MSPGKQYYGNKPVTQLAVRKKKTTVVLNEFLLTTGRARGSAVGMFRVCVCVCMSAETSARTSMPKKTEKGQMKSAAQELGPAR